MPLFHKCSSKHNMEKVISSIQLKALIFSLEQKQKEEELLFKEQLSLVAKSLKPANIIKSTFLDLSKSANIKDRLINSSLSLGAGYLTKKLIAGEDSSILKKALGTLLQIGVSSVVSKNSEGIKFGLAEALKLFSTKKESAA